MIIAFTEAQFRSRLVVFQREYERLLERNEELETVTNRHSGTTGKLETKCRSLEQKVNALQSQLENADRMRREYEAKVSTGDF